MSAALSFLRRNALLFVTLCACLFVYFHMTRPAIERNRVLDDRVRSTELEVDQLRHREAVSDAWVRALLLGDEPSLSRVISDRFRPDDDSDGAASPAMRLSSAPSVR